MSDAVRTGLRGLGQTLITVGVVVLLFCVYELQVTNLITARAQDRLGDSLTRSWAEAPRQGVPGSGEPGQPAPAQPVAAPALGNAFARLYAPSLPGFGSRVVVEGVGVEDLKDGPGHIPATALPGEVGNVVLSGHRTTYGGPFNRWAELQPGDAVVLETRDSWFTYTISGSEIVAPTAVEVTLPVPRQRGATPTRALLTMTTCNPKYSAKQRLIVSAVLSATTPKSAGLPPALKGA